MSARALSYRWAGQREHCLAMGPEQGPVLLIIPPLFDEMNRMRRTLVRTMARLAEQGVATRLIDLPGCNESLAAIAEQSLAGWRGAVAAAADSLDVSHVLALRGGALIDPALAAWPRLRIEPVAGAALLRTLLRSRITADKEAGLASNAETLRASARASPLELAGYTLCGRMIAELSDAAPSDETVATRRIADGDLAGAKLWLRAEPGDDPALAQSLCDAVTCWLPTCAIS